MAAYRKWESDEGVVASIEDLEECCRYEAEQTTSYEAQFYCKFCETGWTSR